MLPQHQDQNGFPPTEHNDRFQTAIRFYLRKFHFIAIPLIIILVAIHLKFAIQYLGQCPIQPMINIYMIVHATVQVVLMLITFIQIINIRCIYLRDGEQNKTVGRIILVVGLISTLVLLLFSLAWLIAGSVWIFGAKTNGVQGSIPNATTTYCESDLFNAAFTLLIINYVMHGLIIFIVVMRCICRKNERILDPGIDMNTMSNRI
jgi:hypothetical protein